MHFNHFNFPFLNVAKWMWSLTLILNGYVRNSSSVSPVVSSWHSNKYIICRILGMWIHLDNEIALKMSRSNVWYFLNLSPTYNQLNFWRAVTGRRGKLKHWLRLPQTGQDDRSRLAENLCLVLSINTD